MYDRDLDSTIGTTFRSKDRLNTKIDSTGRLAQCLLRLIEFDPEVVHEAEAIYKKSDAFLRLSINNFVNADIDNEIQGHSVKGWKDLEETDPGLLKKDRHRY